MKMIIINPANLHVSMGYLKAYAHCHNYVIKVKYMNLSWAGSWCTVIECRSTMLNSILSYWSCIVTQFLMAHI